MRTGCVTTSRFSDLERRLLKSLTEGEPSKLIARELAISEASLYRRVKSLQRKLGADLRAADKILAGKKAF